MLHGFRLKLTENRRLLRLDAADQLAEIPALLWEKDDPEAWMTLRIALDRLSIRLNLVGVHPSLTDRLHDAAVAFWESLHVVGEGDHGDVWAPGQLSYETWTEVSGVVALVLATNNRIGSWWVDQRMRKQLRLWDEQEQAVLASLE